MSRSLFRQKLSGSHYLNTFVYFDFKQMSITRYDEIGATIQCTFKKNIISGIIRDHRYLAFGFNMPCMSPQVSEEW